MEKWPERCTVPRHAKIGMNDTQKHGMKSWRTTQINVDDMDSSIKRQIAA
jgi:hypothetical protein